MPITTLTERERAVLRAVGRGLTDAEIAARLGVPETAVAGQLRDIRRRLGLRDRSAAIVYAFDHGIATATPAPGPPLEISVLGPPRAWRAGEPLDLGPVRQQALLAALALRPDTTRTKQDLLDDVWGPEAPSGNVVQVYVYRLRKCLAEPVIARDRFGYRFLGAGVLLDITRVEEIAAEAEAAARAGDLAAAVDTVSRALGLFRGEPLAGLPGPFADGERFRLRERRLALIQRKASWQLRLGRHADAIAELRACAAADPHHEPVTALLMRALHETGRPAEALAAFARLRRRLAEDLGVAPGIEARRVHEVIRRGAVPVAV
ncbi:hypothetical protein GCM10017786_54030 [Amycolatopsis deserti]|uniref:Transcriptional regulator n=1 Tax=Amycolatopsis deserti TaxID=185696 RepID=A0ABQ3JDM4_9PSEU|nr:BTAD domain-containing putative transcriptional regulator [Amycolatopsis deserti]GHF13222.1 hypothetical protein GCM10017786_54030 [Amycolatopsis deserti]